MIVSETFQNADVHSGLRKRTADETPQSMPYHGRRRLRRLMVWCACSLGLILYPGSLPLHAATHPMIGELNVVGSSLSAADEWIELWNVSDEPLSLDGYSLQSGSDLPIFFSASSTISAHGAFVVANYKATDVKSVLAITPDMVTTSVSLANEGFTLNLLNATGQIVDQAVIKRQSSAVFASLIRQSLDVPGNASTTWNAATSSRNFKPDAPDTATPGWCDVCSSSAAHNTDTSPAVTVASSTATTDSTSLATSASQETMSSTSASITPPLVPSSTEALPVQIISDNSTVSPSSSALPTTSNETPNVLPVSSPIAEPTRQTSDSPTDRDILWSLVMRLLNQSAPRIEQSSGNVFLFQGPVTIQSLTLYGADPRIQTPFASVTAPLQTNVPLAPMSSSATSPLSAASSLDSSVATPVAVRATLSAASTGAPSASGGFAPVVRLNEIAPHPSSGAEWIELTIPNGLPLSSLLGFRLEDSHSTIFSFTSSSLAALETSGNFLRVQLASKRLNDSGDAVFLRDAQNRLLDYTTFSSLARDYAWARDPFTDEWKATNVPTPFATNIIQLPSTWSGITPVSTPPTNLPTYQPTAPSTVLNSPAISSMPFLSLQTSRLTSSSTAHATNRTLTRSHTTSSRIVARTRTSSAAAFSAPRIRIRGTVGSIPGLLNKNQFVVLNPDGRGLLIQGNGRQPSPPLGTLVEVTGTLVTNDDGTRLRMASADAWRSIVGTDTVQPRLVNLLAPSHEDDWSLVEVTGTVREINGQLVRLTADEIDFAMRIRPIIKYRPARLQTGDELRVRGLLEISGDEPTILPRSTDEITLLSHAIIQHPTAAPATPQTPWMPLGAAGITIVAAQGVKKLQKIREQRRLTRLLTEASQRLTAEAEF